MALSEIKIQWIFVSLQQTELFLVWKWVHYSKIFWRSHKYVSYIFVLLKKTLFSKNLEAKTIIKSESQYIFPKGIQKTAHSVEYYFINM